MSTLAVRAAEDFRASGLRAYFAARTPPGQYVDMQYPMTEYGIPTRDEVKAWTLQAFAYGMEPPAARGYTISPSPFPGHVRISNIAVATLPY